MNWLKKMKRAIRDQNTRFLRAYVLWYASVSKLFRVFMAERSARGMYSLIMGIIGLSVGSAVAAATLPQAIIDLTNGSLWTGAPAPVQNLATSVVGIVIIVIFIIMLLKFGGVSGD